MHIADGLSRSSGTDNILLRQCRRVFIERARLRRLAWGDAVAVRALAAEALGAHPSRSGAWRQSGAPPLCSTAGFDLVVGADVVYVAEAVPALFAAAAVLLSASQEARSQGARCLMHLGFGPLETPGYNT